LLYRFHEGCEIPSGPLHLTDTKRSWRGYGPRRRALALGLRLIKGTPRFSVPPSAAAVAKFWNSSRTLRDLARVGGCCWMVSVPAVLALRLADLPLADAPLRVLGK
jgi:hypothetical protein